MIIAPMAGTPAAAKGLRTGDIISAVADQPTEDITLDDVVDLVRGPEGTEVKLTITRPGLKEPFDVQIEAPESRRKPSAMHSWRDRRWVTSGFGEFTTSSTREVGEAIDRLDRRRHGISDL